jgi:hypothetical protein
MQSIRVTVIGKDGCHLCDEATEVITGVLQGFSNVSLEHRDLAEDPEWQRDYADKIPVVLIDGQEHAYWRVRAERLRESLAHQGAISG